MVSLGLALESPFRLWKVRWYLTLRDRQRARPEGQQVREQLQCPGSCWFRLHPYQIQNLHSGTCLFNRLLTVFFVFLYSSWDSHGKYTGVVCHSLLQWILFCQNSPLWPIHHGWPYTAWLIASLNYASPMPWQGSDPWRGSQMASLMLWTWTWANFGRWWGTGKPGVLQSMGLQRVGHNWLTEQPQQLYFYNDFLLPLL